MLHINREVRSLVGTVKTAAIAHMRCRQVEVQVSITGDSTALVFMDAPLHHPDAFMLQVKSNAIWYDCKVIDIHASYLSVLIVNSSASILSTLNQIVQTHADNLPLQRTMRMAADFLRAKKQSNHMAHKILQLSETLAERDRRTLDGLKAIALFLAADKDGPSLAPGPAVH